MQTFSYRSKDGDLNQAQIFKTGTSKPAYQIDFADGLLSSGITISSGATVATDAAGLTVTSACIGTTAVVGTLVTQLMLTCGAGGTAAAPDGARFKLTTTATCSNGEILNYSTFVLVQAPTYNPD